MSEHIPPISGSTAAEIAADIRGRIERGELTADTALPPVRALAEASGVNRNTIVAAYRHLASAGLVVSRARAGTRVAARPRAAQEGFAADTVLRDVGNGNPDPDRIPDPLAALRTLAPRPVLYGEPVIDAELARWARTWITPDLPSGIDAALTVTGGAVDAVERLLAQSLVRDDAVGLEDPCFLASIHTARLGGYRAVPIRVDDEGMTVDGLRAALDDGVRAVVVTPRAQNPTGASLSAERAAALRDVLADHPFVLVIEDDHYSLLSSTRYESLISPTHRRWALVRSVSKFLGPDMCLAITASDPDTAARLGLRLSPGTTWVSHLLQRLAHAQLTDESVMSRIEQAGRHYAERNRAFAAMLTERGLRTRASDGLNLWVSLPRPARDVSDALMRRGWLARTGDEFMLGAGDVPSARLRLTVHDLDADEAARFADDLAAAAFA